MNIVEIILLLIFTYFVWTVLRELFYYFKFKKIISKNYINLKGKKILEEISKYPKYRIGYRKENGYVVSIYFLGLSFGMISNFNINKNNRFVLTVYLWKHMTFKASFKEDNLENISFIFTGHIVNHEINIVDKLLPEDENYLKDIYVILKDRLTELNYRAPAQ